MGTHQASSHPVFVQGGLLESVMLPAAPTSQPGAPTPGSQPHPDPAPAQSCSSPSPAGSWEGAGATSPAYDARGDPENKHKFVPLGIQGSWFPCPLGLLQPPGVPSSGFNLFAGVQDSRIELGSNPCSANSIGP